MTTKFHPDYTLAEIDALTATMEGIILILLKWREAHPDRLRRLNQVGGNNLAFHIYRLALESQDNIC